MFTKKDKNAKSFGITIPAICAAILFALYCTSFDFENPLDPKFSYTLTVNAGDGGSVSIEPQQESYAGGTSVTITAIPNTSNGYVFTGWSGASTSSNSTLSIVMDENKALTANFHYIEYGTFTDPRDGQVYRMVTIGTQTWMAENLNYETSSGSWCYDNNTSNCNTYGRLYDWATTMNISSSCNSQTIANCVATVNTPHQGICPEGWHLPTDAEWITLVNFVGSNAGTKLKSSSHWEAWSGVPRGTNQYGFSALPGGIRRDGSFSRVDRWGRWWSATESDADDARFRQMRSYYEVVESYWDDKSNGFSVRCVRN